MGIPYYFYTLTKSYNDIITNQCPQGNIGMYCMDFNGVIHPICAEYNAKHTMNDDIVVEELYKKVLRDIDLLNPKQALICVDGVVPLAKMIQQRKRRYLTVYKNRIDNITNNWDTNAITPGTKFMQKINMYFKKQIRYSTSKCQIKFSGSDEYGEGEHKIFKMLETAPCDNDNIIINGLDADLIILSLISHRKNIYLMRENDSTMFLNIDKLREAIVRELQMKWNISDVSNTTDLIETYCVMCSLLGNDFIPHLLTLNMKTNGLERLITHTGLSCTRFGLLVQNSEINYTCLSDILEQIAKTEQDDIHKETSRYLKHKAPLCTQNSEYYALRNKEDIASTIYANSSNWQQVYYKKLFSTNINIDSTVIANACCNYIKGVYWTYAYYKRKNYDKLWHYPYGYPPSVRDIANYILGNDASCMVTSKTADNFELNANLQLLIVLPLESKHLLDEQYQKYMEDSVMGLKHLYPKTYKIHTFLKTHLWECAPDLPTISIDHLKRHIK
jgi:5'-3' exonuclease